MPIVGYSRLLTVFLDISVPHIDLDRKDYLLFYSAISKTTRVTTQTFERSTDYVREDCNTERGSNTNHLPIASFAIVYYPT